MNNSNICVGSLPAFSAITFLISDTLTELTFDGLGCWHSMPTHQQWSTKTQNCLSVSVILYKLDKKILPFFSAVGFTGALVLAAIAEGSPDYEEPAWSIYNKRREISIIIIDNLAKWITTHSCRMVRISVPNAWRNRTGRETRVRIAPCKQVWAGSYVSRTCFSAW